jgi:Domain of unknown function (DUF4395)
VFEFPNPVNEVSARIVAGVVALAAIACVALDLRWLMPVLAYGFVARTLTGPRLSPLALLVTKVVTPRLPLAERPVAGPPKRFAQGMGAAISVSAVVVEFGLGAGAPAQVLLATLAAAATAESVLGFCVGCRIFAALIRLGVIPEATCARCAEFGFSAEARAS